MPAKIKIYIDKECTKELYRNDIGAFLYRYKADNEDGTFLPYIDGDIGGKFSMILYLKNIGTRAALNTRLIVEKNSEANFIQENDPIITAGDIAVNNIKSVELKATVEPWTTAQLHTTRVILDYYSLPDQVSESTSSVKYTSFINDTNAKQNIEGLHYEVRK